MAGKLVPCKSCGKEVAQNAKSCPNCGEDHPGIKMGKGCGYGCLVVIVLFLIFAGIGLYQDLSNPPDQAPATTAKAWYEKGTLHKSIIADWKKADSTDKLATAADWILAASPAVKKKTMDSGTMETLKPYARELVECMDKAVDGIDVADKNRSAENAVVCMKLMGWL